MSNRAEDKRLWILATKKLSNCFQHYALFRSHSWNQDHSKLQASPRKPALISSCHARNKTQHLCFCAGVRGEGVLLGRGNFAFLIGKLLIFVSYCGSNCPKRYAVQIVWYELRSLKGTNL
eukprot:2566215-Rhodomonas_salina.3